MALLRSLRLPQLQLVRMAGSGANFREMAEALHLTQPAITKMARELERALGAPVFHRSAAGVRLNLFGQAVLVQARRVLAPLDQLAEDLPRYRAGAPPALRIGSPSFTAASVLARPVAQWLGQAPGMRVVLNDGVSAQLLAGLRAGELDCVFGNADDGPDIDGAAPDLAFEPLFEDQVSFVTSTQTQGLQGVLELAALQPRPWVLPPRNSLVWTALRREFTRAGLALPRGFVEGSSIPAIGAILHHAPGMVGALRADAGLHLEHHFGLRVLQVRPQIALPTVGIVRLSRALPAPGLESLLPLVRAEVDRLFGPHRAGAPGAVARALRPSGRTGPGSRR